MHAFGSNQRRAPRYLSRVENQSSGGLADVAQQLGLIWTKGNPAKICIVTGPDD
jgi:hypothetical protein